EPDALTKDRLLRGVHVGRDYAGVRHGLQPVRAWPHLERVVDGPLRAVLDRPRAPGSIGEGVEAHVGGDAIEPGPQGRAAVESVETSPGAHHRLLDGVVRIERRAEHAVAVPRQCGAMLLEMADVDGHL